MSEEISPLIDNQEPGGNCQGVSINIESQDLKSSTFILYKRRFYIVIVFSTFALLQGAIWNTWGPVSDTASKIYGWDSTTVALLPNWGPILFIIAFIPMVKMLLRFGLRMTTLHCSLLVLIGAGLRCIPCSNLWKTILAHACGVLNGYCGTLAMIAPTAVTATWFPPNERTTSTAIMTLSNSNIAMGLSFLIAKLMVRDLNVTDYGNSSDPGPKIAEMRQDMDHFMYLEFGISAVLFLFVLFYFPKRPPSPPSSSATVERVEFKRGAAIVFRQLNFWLILLSYALSSGAQVGLTSVLSVGLKDFGISQETSDWLGFYSSMVGIPSGFLFSRLADCRKAWMKSLLIVAVFCAGLSYLWFALICFGVLPGETVTVKVRE